jgi:hypothetical protein
VRPNRRTRSLASLVAGALLCGTGIAGIVTTAHAEEAPGSGFQSISLAAVAGGQRIIADEMADQPPGTINTGVPEAEVTMTSSTGHALSSVAWPSALVGNLGTLLFLLGPSPCTPSQYIPPLPAIQPQCSPVEVPAAVMGQYHYLNSPVRAEAQYPTTPEADNSVPGATMIARAGADETVADAILGGAIASDAARFASTRATSVARLTGVATAIADARSTVTDFELADGEVTIGSVVSFAHAETNGAQAKATGGTTIHDMKIHGIPVVVDGAGVHVDEQVVDVVGPAAAMVNQVLTNMGMTMFVTSPTNVTKEATATFDAGSLVITWEEGATFVLGGAHVTASATLPFQANLTEVPPLDVAIDGPTDELPVQSFDSLGGSLPPGVIDPPSGGPAPPPVIGPQLTGSTTTLPGGLQPMWVLFALAGSAVLATGLRRYPERVLHTAASTCPLELKT